GATLPPGAVRSPGATLPPGAIRSPGATLPPGAASLPGMTSVPGGRSEKDIFEDTDFEVAALGEESDDRTIQLEAASSEYDLDEADSGSEVFAVDEEDVDVNAATALRSGIHEEE